MIRPFILRRRKDEVEKYLPSKTQVILKCDLSAWQKACYKSLTEDGKVNLGQGKQFLHALFAKDVVGCSLLISSLIRKVSLKH